jgi:hypothetical protein
MYRNYYNYGRKNVEFFDSYNLVLDLEEWNDGILEC